MKVNRVHPSSSKEQLEIPPSPEEASRRMSRVHSNSNTELLAIPPEDASKMEDLKTMEEERKRIKKFSWNVAVNLFEKVMESRVGRGDIYYLDNHVIQDESFLEEFTEEICREYGLDLLNIIADLVVPVGFGYPSLVGSFSEVVDDAFKPVPEQLKQKKLILWVEDSYWRHPEKSILTTLVQHLLIFSAEPFLIAPNQYFDRDVMASFTRKFFGGSKVENARGVPDPESVCKAYSTFVRFGFLLALRSSLPSPLVILHFGQKMKEKIGALQLLDLAEKEGHEIIFLKNKQPTDRKLAVSNCVKILKGIPNVFPSNTKTVRFQPLPEPSEVEERRIRIGSDSTASVTTEEVEGLLMELEHTEYSSDDSEDQDKKVGENSETK